MAGWRDRPLSALLASAGLEDATEVDLATDGWSGATFTTLEHPDGRRFVLKRTSLERDWIARATRDTDLREAWLAGLGAGAIPEPEPGRIQARTAYLGAASDALGVAAILMPDLSRELIAWERPGQDPVIDPGTLQRVIDAIAALHRLPWSEGLDAEASAADLPAPPWCPLPERLALLSRSSATRYAAEGNPVGGRFLAGWEAFDRVASPQARSLVRELDANLGPLLAALGRLPSVGLHGDLKLANVAVRGSDRVDLIDWQMTMRAPVAVELGWFLVSNVASLPWSATAVLEAYRAALDRHDGGRARDSEPTDGERVLGDWSTQVDLAMVVGLVLRGWRKGLDAEAARTLPTGQPATEDLGWWCDRAVEAARRRL